MKTHNGSCHCGAVRFEVTTDLTKVVECNCSICTKKGVLHHRVSPEQFKLISGEEALSLYQFGTMQAKHYFCKYCGMQPFCRPRGAPDMVNVNVRCLDDVDLEKAVFELMHFDGKNWEEAIKAFK